LHHDFAMRLGTLQNVYAQPLYARGHLIAVLLALSQKSFQDCSIQAAARKAPC
jgi:hypothetical protein